MTYFEVSVIAKQNASNILRKQVNFPWKPTAVLKESSNRASIGRGQLDSREKNNYKTIRNLVRKRYMKKNIRKETNVRKQFWVQQTELEKEGQRCSIKVSAAAFVVEILQRPSNTPHSTRRYKNMDILTMGTAVRKGLGIVREGLGRGI